MPRADDLPEHFVPGQWGWFVPMEIEIEPPIRKSIGHLRGQLQRQPGLADAALPLETKDSRAARFQCGAQSRQFLLAPCEVRWRGRRHWCKRGRLRARQADVDGA